MTAIELTLEVNGAKKTFAASPGERLSDLLRRAGYLSVKVGCSTGDCGTCTVLVDGEPIVSCLMLAAQADGASILTAEGLAHGGDLHPIQEAFLDEGAVQCGFCIPGMMLSAYALLEAENSPTEDDVRECLSGNLCRCTGYENPVRAVLRAAERAREGRS